MNSWSHKKPDRLCGHTVPLRNLTLRLFHKMCNLFFLQGKSQETPVPPFSTAIKLYKKMLKDKIISINILTTRNIKSKLEHPEHVTKRSSYVLITQQMWKACLSMFHWGEKYQALLVIDWFDIYRAMTQKHTHLRGF